MLTVTLGFITVLVGFTATIYSVPGVLESNDKLQKFANTSFVDAKLIEINGCSDDWAEGVFLLDGVAKLYSPDGDLRSAVLLNHGEEPVRFSHSLNFSLLDNTLARRRCEELVHEQATFCTQIMFDPLRIVEVLPRNGLSCANNRKIRYNKIKHEKTIEICRVIALLLLSFMAAFVTAIAFDEPVSEIDTFMARRYVVGCDRKGDISCDVPTAAASVSTSTRHSSPKDKNT